MVTRSFKTGLSFIILYKTCLFAKNYPGSWLIENNNEIKIRANKIERHFTKSVRDKPRDLFASKILREKKRDYS